ncbi:MAG TPA: efflux RND transporter periplasmic adaptor subunit, partial [Phycisphaerales bacterium]|nr:efflux RND transporter periplasmic adaptor subunit [Phycisphaerales bacterium]
ADHSGLKVRTIVATSRAVPRIWDGYGTARVMDSATVSAQISARVVDRPETIEEGVAVAEGDVLVRLDATIYLSRVQAAEASVASVLAQIGSLDAEMNRLREQLVLAQEEQEIARRNLERVREAAGGGAGTESDIDTASSQLRRAQRTVAALQQQLDIIPPRREQLLAQKTNLEAELAVAQENLNRAAIVAPMDGVIQSVSVDVGDLVNVGSVVARIVNTDRLEIPLRLPISASASVRVGDEVELIADGPVASRWSGEISRIAPEADVNSRTMAVYVEVHQDSEHRREPRLLPGQFVRGRVASRVYEDRILVPRRAVSGDRVMVVADDGANHVAKPIDVRVEYHLEMSVPEIEPAERQWAVIESGLKPGDRVVISNLDQLVGGMRINPTGPGELSVTDSADEAGGS